MRSLPVILVLVIILVTCGCTESPPAEQTLTTATAPATPVVTATTLIPWTTLTTARTTSVSDNTITIVKNTFRPSNITVKAGSTVRWVNADDHPHNIAFRDKDFSASTYLLGSSQSFSQRFDRPGTYEFTCLIHPQMNGGVTVEA